MEDLTNRFLEVYSSLNTIDKFLLLGAIAELNCPEFKHYEFLSREISLILDTFEN